MGEFQKNIVNIVQKRYLNYLNFKFRSMVCFEGFYFFFGYNC